MRSTKGLTLACLILFGSGTLLPAQERKTGPYEAEWDSLKGHSIPEWFRDAKLGIYTHWGPISFANAEAPRPIGWYGKDMYEPKSWVQEYHRKRFGDPKTFGYKDIIPLFRAPKFDAEEWAEIFERSGAKFAGPVAIHHENFALWDSVHTEWDSMDKGPGRDVVGELEKAIRKRGMKFIATFHHSWTWRYFQPAYQYDAADPAFADLYGEPHAKGAPPTAAYLDKWLAMVNEVTEKYQPDLTWFDFGLGKVIPPEYQKRMFADYYNLAARKGMDVGVAHKHWEIHEHTGIIDFERGRMDHLTPFPWLTDTSVGPWYHHRDPQYKSVDQIVDVLADIVSKNGCMLLNVGPDGEGLIPEPAKRILEGIGDWLAVNGEAIFATRPWEVHGEGPTHNAGGGFSERKDKPYGARDIRFTRSKDGKSVFVILLGWPEEPFSIESMEVSGAVPQASVRLLGYDGDVKYRCEEGRLVIEPPPLAEGDRPCRHAFAFRLTGFEPTLSDSGAFNRGGSRMELSVENATAFGKKIRLQQHEGRWNAGYWDDPADTLHFLAPFGEAGTYLVRGEFSSAAGPSRLVLECEGTKTEAAVGKTEDWSRTAFSRFAPLRIEKPGVHHVVLRSADPGSWKPVNVYRIQFAKVPE